MNDPDTPARSAIREALAAIEDAEAAGNADGQELDNEHILEIVSAQRDRWLSAAADSRRAGAIQQAEEMESEAAALDAFLC